MRSLGGSPVLRKVRVYMSVVTCDLEKMREELKDCVFTSFDSLLSYLFNRYKFISVEMYKTAFELFYSEFE